MSDKYLCPLFINISNQEILITPEGGVMPVAKKKATKKVVAKKKVAPKKKAAAKKRTVAKKVAKKSKKK